MPQTIDDWLLRHRSSDILGIVPVECPLTWVVNDVSPNRVQLALGAYDVFVKPSLPETRPGHVACPVDSASRLVLVKGHDLTEGWFSCERSDGQIRRIGCERSLLGQTRSRSLASIHGSDR